MKRSTFKQLIRECIEDVLIENLSQPTVYPQNFKSVKNYITIKKKSDTNEVVVYWVQDGRINNYLSYFTDDQTDALNTFEKMKSEVDRMNERDGLQEMTSTGAVQGVMSKNWVDPTGKKGKKLAANSMPGGKVC